MRQLPELFPFFSNVSEEMIEIYNEILSTRVKQLEIAKQKALETLLLFPEGSAKKMLELQAVPYRPTDPKGTILEIFWLTVIEKSLEPGFRCSESLDIKTEDLCAIGLDTNELIRGACKEIAKVTKHFVRFNCSDETLTTDGCKDFRFACDLTMSLPLAGSVTT